MNYLITGKFIESSKHIAIVTPGFASDESDTSCIPALQDYLLALKKSGVKISVFALHYPFRQDVYDWFGIKVYALGGKNQKFLRKSRLSSRLEKSFLEANSETKIDLIHSFWLNQTTFFAENLARQMSIPIVASAQGQDVLAENKYLNKLDKATTLVSMSNFQKDKLAELGIESKVILWGTNAIEQCEKEYDLIAVGNMIPLKNHTYFIDLCQQLKQFEPDFKALIVGDGAERNKLIEKINEFGLTQNIELKGALNRQETLELISKSKVLVHPSKFEGFGMVLIEALAAGTQVLASPVGFAYDSEFINQLTFDLNKDIETLKELIAKKIPEPILVDIKQTVIHYVVIYKAIS